MGVFRQFPYSNFHEMNMDEIIKIVKNMLEEWAQYHAEWDSWMASMNEDWSNYQEVMNEAWQNMQDFINNYFDNLDVQNEINNKIASMVYSGEFATIVEPYIPTEVSAWLSEHITEPEGVVIDTSLSVAGACADAKVTGDEINTLKNTVYEMPIFNWQSIGTTEYPTGFRTGYYDEDGHSASSGYRCRTIAYVPYSANTQKIVIAPPSGYSVQISEYNSSGTFIRNIGAVAYGQPSGPQEVEITQGYKYHVTIGWWASSLTNDDLTNDLVNGFVLTMYNSRVEELVDMVPLALSSDGAIMIPDNTDFNTLLTAGTYKVTNNTHAATMTNMPIQVSGKLIVLNTSQINRIVQIYIVDTLAIPARTYTRLFQITTGGTNITEWRYLPNSDETIQNYIETKHESGSYGPDGKATERITIRIKSINGMILYRLYHFVDADNNCNGWQIFAALKADRNGGNSTEITLSGEWECAVKLNGRDDFSGGHTHGDEIMTDVVFLANGVPIDITTLTNYTFIQELRVIQTSTLYDPDDHTTAIAKHGKEYIFTTEGLVLNQSLEWLVAENLDNCFLAMFMPRKDMIDRASANADFETLTLPSEMGSPLTTITKPKSTSVTMWDTETGISAAVSVPVYPTGLSGGDKMTISDNSGLNYNKVYFYVCSSGSSTIGELWKSTAIYKLAYTAQN